MSAIRKLEKRVAAIEDEMSRFAFLPSESFLRKMAATPDPETAEPQTFARSDRVRVVSALYACTGADGARPESERLGQVGTVICVRPVDGKPCCYIQFPDRVAFCWPHNLALVPPEPPAAPPPKFVPRRFSGNQWSVIVNINADGDRVLLRGDDEDTQVTIAMSGHSARQIAEALIAAAWACIPEEEKKA